MNDANGCKRAAADDVRGTRRGPGAAHGVPFGHGGGRRAGGVRALRG
ncbi:hypothetical protein SUDANB126_00989 [Streptomyces sp. enrichment culture]